MKTITFTAMIRYENIAIFDDKSIHPEQLTALFFSGTIKSFVNKQPSYSRIIVNRQTDTQL
jgi:hypothetical protein